MEKAYYLDQLVKRREFRFDRLELKGIDNAPVKRMFGSGNDRARGESFSL